VRPVRLDPRGVAGLTRVEPDEVVASIAERPERTGVFLDLDGTLAPIVARPELARVLPGVPEVLQRLVGRLGVVAIVSGRPSSEVRTLVGVEGIEAVGTHGLEHEPSMPAEIRRRIEAVAATVGAWVEEKGAAAAVHFRALEDPEAAATAASPGLAAVAAAHGLEIVPGKRILELMPAGRARKGGAVERIVRSKDLTGVLFAGDDVGDLDAFGALDRLRLAGAWTCSVVVAGAETPPPLLAAGDLIVTGPDGMVALLRSIADAVEAAA
jgi:trehalose 6-phosphate phosphatase